MNKGFTIELRISTDNTSISCGLLFMGTCIAVFQDSPEIGDEIRSYLWTHGYLAEWSRQHILGNSPCWFEELCVHETR